MYEEQEFEIEDELLKEIQENDKVQALADEFTDYGFDGTIEKSILVHLISYIIDLIEKEK